MGNVDAPEKITEEHRTAIPKPGRSEQRGSRGGVVISLRPGTMTGSGPPQRGWVAIQYRPGLNSCVTFTGLVNGTT